MPAVAGVSADYLHAVLFHQEATDTELNTLKSLLHYGESREVKASNPLSYFVSPRAGTISPWSSKATDIAHNCGLKCVERVERCQHYKIDISDNKSLSESEINTIKSMIHDRMIEAVYETQDQLDVLFDATE